MYIISKFRARQTAIGRLSSLNGGDIIDHRHSHGVQLVHLHPQGGEKIGVTYRENM